MLFRSLFGQNENNGNTHASTAGIAQSITPRTCMNTRQRHCSAPGLRIAQPSWAAPKLSLDREISPANSTFIASYGYFLVSIIGFNAICKLEFNERNLEGMWRQGKHRLLLLRRSSTAAGFAINLSLTDLPAKAQSGRDEQEAYL